MENANDFFTFQSLLTFGGATTATVVVSNAIQYVTQKNPRWLALAIAQAVCFGTVLITLFSGNDGGAPAPVASSLFVAAINGFLVFSSAVGITQMAPDDGAGAGGQTARSVLEGQVNIDTASSRQRGFWSNWY